MVDVVKRLDDADKESALLQSKLEALQCTFPRELPASITRDTPSGALGYYRCGASATTHKAAAAFSTYHSSVSITPTTGRSFGHARHAPPPRACLWRCVLAAL